MEKYPQPIAAVLADGYDLREFGSLNRGFSRSSALATLEKLAEVGVAVLGGDVWERTDTSAVLTYDNWHCERSTDEVYNDYVTRSIDAAKKYILEYVYAGDYELMFSIVPDSNNCDGT